MSNLTSITPSRLFRNNYLERALVESFMTGLYTVTVLMTLYAIAHRRSFMKKSIVISIVLLMYSFQIIHLALRWWSVKQAFIRHGDTAEEAVAFLQKLPRWFLVMSGFSSDVNIVLANCVLVWRCWTVWNHRWGVVTVPTLSTIVQAGLLVWNLSLEVSQDPSDEYIQNLLYATDIACTILSLFTTLTGTSLIVCRLLRVGRISGTGKYWSTIEIVVESSMLYSVALIFDMVILLTQVSYDGYALGILAPITGIAPTLLLARVSLGLAQADETWSKPATFFDPDGHTGYGDDGVRMNKKCGKDRST